MDGNHRYYSAFDLGLKEAPAVLKLNHVYDELPGFRPAPLPLTLTPKMYYIEKAGTLQGAADDEPVGEMEDQAGEDNEVAGDMTQADGVGQFYRSASMGIDIPLPKWLMTGSQGGSDSGASNSDIAQAAREHLAHKTFSPAEQRELIDEGQDAKAANLQSLDLTGTHYEALEAALAQADATGEDVIWW